MDQSSDQLTDSHESKRRYNVLVAEVTRAINEADPIGLLRMACPPDEYSPEIGAIVPRAAKASSEVEVCQIVHNEFKHWFGGETAGPIDLYAKPAAAIWEAVLAFRRDG